MQTAVEGLSPPPPLRSYVVHERRYAPSGVMAYERAMAEQQTDSSAVVQP
jgi:hypothetical protein